MTISTLKPLEVVKLLDNLNLSIDQWGRLKDKIKEKEQCRKYYPSRDALELYCFAFHVAGWTRNDEWRLMLFDNSSSLSFDEKIIFSQFSSGDFEDILSMENSALLVDLGFESQSRSEIQMAHLIYFSLLFEAHCWIVSSASKYGQRLGVQDGFVYFISRDKAHVDSAQDMISNYEACRRKMPNWVVNPFGASH